jgi:UDP-N-acetylmuramate dehydrogenase
MDLTEVIGLVADAAVRLSCKAEFNTPLRDYTTFKIGGNVPLLVNVNSFDALACIRKLLKIYAAPYLVIGNGSNLLVDDKGVNRIVIRIGGDFSGIKVNGCFLDCEAGALLSGVCKIAARRSLSGIEPLFGIPGSVGGAVYMNAGAYGREMADVVESVSVITSDGTTKVYQASECLFSYRESIFLHNNDIISSVRLKLSHGEHSLIRKEMDSFTARRREKQPIGLPSAGSAFKRPTGAYASALIDECGLKGFAVGGAQISNKHAGFIVNNGGATFDDVINLMKSVIGIVELQTGYRLEPEPVIISDTGVDFYGNG